MTRPMVVVGFVSSAPATLALTEPDRSVIVVEEPDVVRKRGVRDRVAGAAVVRDLIEWEFHRPGTADEFANAHPDLDPCAVVPLTEYATPFAARLAERYRRPGAGYGAALILRDKALLRQVTRAAGIANPDSAAVSGPEDVLAFMDRHPGPVVLKPANRQAAVGTRILRDRATVPAAWAACVRQDEGALVPDRGFELRMLAERCVEGTEFSVEMLVRAGEPLFTNVTGKQLFPGPYPVESGHVVPSGAPAALSDRLAADTSRVLAAVGFADGIVHCEWIVSGGVPYLVECAGRFAGDGIVELIQRAYEMELARAYYAVLKGTPVPELPRSPRKAAAVRFLSAGAGVVAAISGTEAATAADGVFHCAVDVAVGDRHGGLRSSWDRVGEVMVTADGPAEAVHRADAAAALITLDIRTDAPDPTPVPTGVGTP